MQNRIELTERIFVLKERKSELKNQLKEIDDTLEGLEQELTMLMENQHLQNFKDDRFGTVYLHTSFYPRIIDEEKTFNFLNNNNLNDVIVIKKSVPREALREILSQHGEIPGVDSNYSETSVRFRK